MSTSNPAIYRIFSWIGIFFGVLFLLLGIMLFRSDSNSVLDDLISYLGISLGVLGMVLAYMAYRYRKASPKSYLLLGLIALLFFGLGIYFLLKAPELSKFYHQFIGIWAILFGIAQFIQSTRVKSGKMVLYIGAGASIVLGVLITLKLTGGSGQVPGIYTIILGIILLFMGIRSLSSKKSISPDQTSIEGSDH